MSGHNAGLEALSATQIEHVDAICERFERAWEAGQRPKIEDYFGGEPEPGRSVLLHELLASELEWRLRRGERPDRQEYLERFGSQALLNEAAFEAALIEARRQALGMGAPVEADPDATPPYPPDVSARGSPAAGRRFRILRPHAEGGLGVVFVAHDEELHREVALKEIQPVLASRPDSRARFLREAEITGGLEHPGIVPVYSLGEHPDGRPYYAMRLIRGTSFKEAITEFHRVAEGDTDPGVRSLALRKLLDRFRAACEALAYAHSRGVLHRDIKPHNIMVGRYGETLLVDWGLARETGRPEMGPDGEEWPPRPIASEGPDATAAGTTIGTPAYMSPEQAEGRLDRLGPASDVYGLGATLYHLLTGRPPFAGSTPEVLAQVRRGDLPRPRSVRRDISRALEVVCLKAMAARPEDRYATALDLAADIERWQADEPVMAWREPWPVRARRWVKRHRTLVIAAFAAVLLTAMVLGGCVLMYCLDHVHVAWAANHH
jgi:eukaryotic-like serine/threonine-protein kinase